LSFVINHLASLSSLAAETERLDALLSALGPDGGVGAGASTGVRRSESDLGGGGLRVEGLTLTTPHGELVLCRDLSFELRPGQSLLVVGPSGAGKSSLMRAFAGLWSRGAGVVHTPPHSQLFFLPQKPYMPLGCLRTQLVFPDVPAAGAALSPSAAADVESGGGGKLSPQDDAHLAHLLDVVSLPSLLSRVGGLDATCDWSHVLSLGEQQRVAFLRLLRRRPAVAFLDESSSGVDAAVERKLYQALAAACPCYVSVGHRKELVQLHTHVLAAQGGGRWTLCTAAEYAAGLV
jgi:putative ATP-binding cassette transporter